jgi:hypothetical protein
MELKQAAREGLMATYSNRPVIPHPTQNRLLAALPESEAGRLFPQLDLVKLHPGEHLYESGDHMIRAYFPTTAIVSLRYVTEHGGSAEMIGNEGLLGIVLFMGGALVSNQAVVHHPGQAYLLNGPLLKDEFDRSGVLRSLLLRYVQARLTGLMQTVVCVQHHSVNQQLCRWLLMGLDRLAADHECMNQGLIEAMVPLPLEVVSGMVDELQRAGLIRRSSDCIAVVDRPGLEARVCECYKVVRKEFRRLVPSTFWP